MATFFKPWSNHYALNVHRLGQLVGYVADSYVFGHIPGEVDDGDEWEDGFVSDELDVGSKQTKLHIVNHDDITTWTLIKSLCTE